jgi:hypothetical protein
LLRHGKSASASRATTGYREIVLKNWRENDGIENALLAAGIIEGAPTRPSMTVST